VNIRGVIKTQCERRWLIDDRRLTSDDRFCVHLGAKLVISQRSSNCQLAFIALVSSSELVYYFSKRFSQILITRTISFIQSQVVYCANKFKNSQV